MAIENFTTYTVVEPNTIFTVTAPKIEAENMDRDIDAYVYDDKGAGHFGDFEHLLTAHVKSTSLHGAMCHHWVLSNDVDDANAASGLHFFSNYSAGVYVRWAIGEGTGWCDPRDEYDEADGWDKDRFVRLKRDGTSFTCDVYSTEALRDAGGDGDVCHLSVTVATTTYRYVYGTSSHNSGNSEKDFDGYTQNLDLQEVPPPGLPAPTKTTLTLTL